MPAQGAARRSNVVEILILLRPMPKIDAALNCDGPQPERGDVRESRQRYRNPRPTAEAVRTEESDRMARARLATECQELDPAVEQRLAEEGLSGDPWLEYSAASFAEPTSILSSTD